MDLAKDFALAMTRCHFFGRSSRRYRSSRACDAARRRAGMAGATAGSKIGGLPGLPHFAPKAKRVIFLHQSGGPSQMDLFDYKPNMGKFQGTELPDSIRRGQRITGMTSGQSSFPVASPIFKFQQHGASGTWLSELLPHLSKVVDDIAIVKTMNTDAINHDPISPSFRVEASSQAGRAWARGSATD